MRRGLNTYVFGTMWFDDVFGSHHWTQFCYLVGNDLKARPSGFHNTCDDC
jgi:hypothetical protein